MIFRVLSVAMATLTLLSCAQLGEPVTPRAQFTLQPDALRQANLEFEEIALGEAPAGWIAEATVAGVAGDWQVMQGPDVPSQTHVLGLVHPNHADSSAHNLLWTDAIAFESGRVRVDVLPREGTVSQGGGPIWRVQDAQNHLGCRWDPLKREIAIFVVRDGQMRVLASESVSFPAGEWHRMIIDHHGDHIRCSFAGGSVVLETSSGALPGMGGVGLWTEADALTAFDGLIVQSADPD